MNQLGRGPVDVIELLAGLAVLATIGLGLWWVFS